MVAPRACGWMQLGRHGQDRMALPAVPALPMGAAGKHWGRQRGQWGPLDSCSCQMTTARDVPAVWKQPSIQLLSRPRAASQ